MISFFLQLHLLCNEPVLSFVESLRRQVHRMRCTSLFSVCALLTPDQLRFSLTEEKHRTILNVPVSIRSAEFVFAGRYKQRKCVCVCFIWRTSNISWAERAQCCWCVSCRGVNVTGAWTFPVRAVNGRFRLCSCLFVSFHSLKLSLWSFRVGLESASTGGWNSRLKS